MSKKPIANQSSNSKEKSFGSINDQQETFLNSFISIAKKGIADWELSKRTREKDG